MSITPRRDRRAFLPAVLGISLEERVVMSGAPAWTTILRGSAGSPSGPSTPSGPSSPTGLGDITARQLMTAYNQQFGASRTALQQYINDQISTLYSPANLGANGRPTQQAVADFNNNVGGAINATAFGLSSQVALLPGSSQRLVPNLQQSLLGSGSGSLASRIAAQVNSGRGLASQRLLQNAIDRQIGTAFTTGNGQVSSLLRSPQLGRSTVDSTGQRVSLSQYLGNQAALQINNTFGALANSVGANAQSTLFDSTGAFNSQAVGAFQQQYGNALNAAAYQVNGLLSLLPNSSSIRSGLQSGFFGTTNGTGTPNANLYNALSGVFPTDTGATSTPFTTDAFNTAFQNGFTTAFQNFNGPVATLLNQTSAGSQLPTGFFQTGAAFPSVFGTQFTGSTFNNGFNNGFATTGTGFPGFGTAPSAFNTGFGTGFNGLITNMNGQAGITIPTSTGTIGTGTGTGIGTGTGTGTGTVTGTGTGLGGVVDPTGGVGTGTTGTGIGSGTII